MHERVTVHGICFLGDQFEQQAKYWRELEAHRVCLVGLQIEKEGIAAARAALDTGNYRLENIVSPFLMGQQLNPDEATWSAPRAQLSAQIQAAAQLGANSIYMTTGGHGTNLTWEQSAEVFVNAIAPCVEEARAEGIRLMVENAPFHNADIHIAHTLRDTITLAEMAGIGVCIDLFGCWYEADLKNLIEHAMPRCDLVQVSDYVFGDRAPAARAVPGDGNMPLEKLLDWVLSAGYRGAFDLELFGPRIDKEGRFEAARRAALRTGELLESLGA